MNGLSAELRRTVSITAAIIGAVICVVAIILTRNVVSSLLSVLLGTAVSILNFNLMALAGEKAIDMAPEKARSKMTVSYLIRYAIYIVFLIIAIKIPVLNAIGVAVGYITSIAALYITQFLKNRRG